MDYSFIRRFANPKEISDTLDWYRQYNSQAYLIPVVWTVPEGRTRWELLDYGCPMIFTSNFVAWLEAFKTAFRITPQEYLETLISDTLQRGGWIGYARHPWPGIPPKQPYLKYVIEAIIYDGVVGLRVPGNLQKNA